MEKKEDKAELAAKRLRFAAQSIGDIELPSSLLADIAGKAETELEKRAEDVGLVHIAEIKDDIENAEKDFGKVTGLLTGLDILDKMIGGLKPAEVTIICANSNVGKSWLASDMAIFCSYQVPTLFITLEMRAEQLGARMKIYLDKINGQQSTWCDNCQMYFQKAKTLDYRNIRKLFECASNKGIKAVFLDYLQYLGVGMTPDEMSKISRMFHELALTYNIPIVVVASLRKDVAGNKRRWFDTDENDVKGVGAIVYDCDNLLCCGRSDPANDEFTPDYFWVKHIKSRNMPRDLKFPYGKLKWDGGSITNDDDWYNTVGKYYGHIEDRPTIISISDSRTQNNTVTTVSEKQIQQDFTAGINENNIKEMSEFQQRRLGLYKKG